MSNPSRLRSPGATSGIAAIGSLFTTVGVDACCACSSFRSLYDRPVRLRGDVPDPPRRVSMTDRIWRQGGES